MQKRGSSLTDLARNEARFIALLYRRMTRVLDRELTPLGLGHGRYVYLFGLYNKDGLSQQALADRAGADKAAATRALSRLEADGFITRRRDDCDRRITRVFLSQKGRDIQTKLVAAGEVSIAELNSYLDADQTEQFRSLLETACGPILD